jgi:uncharacterized damage-inducible protein DinB
MSTSPSTSAGTSAGTSLGPYFRRLFAYERDSHAKVLAALQAVPAERRGEPEFRAAVDLFAHLVAARRMWLTRLGVAPAASGGLEPKGTSLAELAPRLAETEGLWERYLTGLDDDAVARRVEYQSLDAGRFENTVGEVLTQLHGHSLYHRGQIALRLRALGCTPPTTDFIFWARKPLA